MGLFGNYSQYPALYLRIIYIMRQNIHKMLAVNLISYFIKTNKNITICVFVNKIIKL